MAAKAYWTYCRLMEGKADAKSKWSTHGDAHGASHPTWSCGRWRRCTGGAAEADRRAVGALGAVLGAGSCGRGCGGALCAPRRLRITWSVPGVPASSPSCVTSPACRRTAPVCRPSGASPRRSPVAGAMLCLGRAGRRCVASQSASSSRRAPSAWCRVARRRNLVSSPSSSSCDRACHWRMLASVGVVVLVRMSVRAGRTRSSSCDDRGVSG